MDETGSKKVSTAVIVAIVALVVLLLVAGALALYYGLAASKCPTSTSDRLAASTFSSGLEETADLDSLHTEAQADRLHRTLQQQGTNFAGGCFVADTQYDAAANLPTESPLLVPTYQAALKNLPAMQSAHLQQAFPGNNIGASAREGIDGSTTVTFDNTPFDEKEDYEARVKQTKGVGISSIYAKGDGLGMSLINQKSRMVDPAKMLPNAKPGQESERLVQVGPSIAEISCRVPKAADLMRMLRASRGSALGQSIPRDRPPIYTTGLNSVRPTRLPAQQGLDSCAIGISPYEVSDLIEYTPNPFLSRSKAGETAFNYSV